MYVENQEKQGYVYIWFRYSTDFTDVIKDMDNKSALTEPSKHLLYHQDRYGAWISQQSYNERNLESYFGYQRYIDRINKDIEVFGKHHELLKSIGENKSLNYLLYGPPGTGKTLIARALACNVEAKFLKVVASAIVDKYIG